MPKPSHQDQDPIYPDDTPGESKAAVKAQGYFNRLQSSQIETYRTLEHQERIARKIRRNALKQKLNKWRGRDAKAGTVAAVAIATLYSGVEKVRNFLQPGIANLILPFFIVADVLTTVASWKQVYYLRELNKDKNQAANRSSWIGVRNPLMRAIFETFWATLGTATVLGAIITSTFLAATVANAFAVVIAPLFMIVLGTRALFNGISSAFHAIRANIAVAKASKLPEESDERRRLLKQAANYRMAAKIQAAVAVTSLIGFAATTVVMLTHHFTFAFIGVGGALALGGLMTYLLRGNSKVSSMLKSARTKLDDHMTSLNNRVDGFEQQYHNTASKLLGVVSGITSSVAKFVAPASVPAHLVSDTTENVALSNNPPVSSSQRIQLAMAEAPAGLLEKIPGAKIAIVTIDNKETDIPVDANNRPIYPSRYGLYQTSAHEVAPAPEAQPAPAPSMAASG